METHTLIMDLAFFLQYKGKTLEVLLSQVINMLSDLQKDLDNLKELLKVESITKEEYTQLRTNMLANFTAGREKNEGVGNEEAQLAASARTSMKDLRQKSVYSR